MLPMTSRLPFVALVAIGVVKYATADVVGRRLRHSTMPTERVLITKYEVSNLCGKKGIPQLHSHNMCPLFRRAGYLKCVEQQRRWPGRSPL